MVFLYPDPLLGTFPSKMWEFKQDVQPLKVLLALKDSYVIYFLLEFIVYFLPSQPIEEIVKRYTPANDIRHYRTWQKSYIQMR